MKTANIFKNTSDSERVESLSFRMIAEVFFFALIVVLFLKIFVLEFYRVESGSMQPELHDGDVVMVSRIAYFFGIPSRLPILGNNFGVDLRLNFISPDLGDVIVFDAMKTGNVHDDNFLIKRIVGVPGDTMIISRNPDSKHKYLLKKNSVNHHGHEIKIPSKGGSIEVNVNNFKYLSSILINEGEIFRQIVDSINANPFYTNKLVLKDDYYFVQGDNIEQSSDSRKFGLIPAKSIIGKAFLLVFPSAASNKKIKLL